MSGTNVQRTASVDSQLSTSAKIAEILEARKAGAEKIDFGLNSTLIVNREWDFLCAELTQIKLLCREYRLFLRAVLDIFLYDSSLFSDLLALLKRAKVDDVVVNCSPVTTSDDLVDCLIFAAACRQLEIQPAITLYRLTEKGLAEIKRGKVDVVRTPNVGEPMSIFSSAGSLV